MIGVDSSSGLTRFTGGNLHLFDGIDFLVAIVGLFAITEVFVFIESHGKETAIGVKLEKISIPVKEIIRALSIDTDKIICTFILAIAYLFVALEEVDYQILSFLNKYPQLHSATSLFPCAPHSGQVNIFFPLWVRVYSLFN